MENGSHSEQKVVSTNGEPCIPLLISLSRSINLLITYGEKHPAAIQAMTESYTIFEASLKTQHPLHLGSRNHQLTANGKIIPPTNSLLRNLEERFNQLQIVGLRLDIGLSRDEFTQFITLLAQPPRSSFHEQFNATALAHITADKTTYEALHSGQTIANTADLKSHKSCGDEVIEIEIPDSAPPSIEVGEIVAFLNGEKTLDEDTGEKLTELASDPAQLGQMILESVSIRQQAAPLAGESLNDIILGCLRRTFKGLRKQSVFQTSDGVAHLQKGLLLLEETMLERLRNLTGSEDPELDRQIIQSIQEMDETLNFERSARSYMEHQAALRTHQEEMECYIRQHGIENAQQHLENCPFPPEEWQQFMHATAPSSPTGVAAGLSSLTTVLEQLEGLMQEQEAHQPQIKALLGKAGENITNAIGQTDQKLNALKKRVQEETGTIGGQAHEMDRKELLSSLAEIAQELMQPLTAVHAAVEMMLRGYSGEITDDQNHLLSLANTGTDNLKHLLRKLIAIVGVPVNRGVDARFTRSQ